MNHKDEANRSSLKEALMKLNRQQLKLFYGMLVHYWAEYRLFISKQNFKRLFFEFNYRCYVEDDNFPAPYDSELLTPYCHAHPYYFIDILTREDIINLFCQYLDDKLDILVSIADKLNTEDLRAAYESSNEALDLSENIDILVAQSEEHISVFS